LTNQAKNSAWAAHPDYHIDIKPLSHRIKIKFNKVTIADSHKVLLVQEQDYTFNYYFPCEDIRTDLLSLTEKISVCPFKGDATHWALAVGNKRVETATWSYQEPFSEVKQIKNYIAFYPEAIEELIST